MGLPRYGPGLLSGGARPTIEGSPDLQVVDQGLAPLDDPVGGFVSLGDRDVVGNVGIE